MLEQLHSIEEVFKGRKVLIVDGRRPQRLRADVCARNKRHGRRSFAENGRDGIEVLQANADVALVLMDIMMPEMDGLRDDDGHSARSRGFKQLPIISLTAKAIEGRPREVDRVRCVRLHNPSRSTRISCLSLMRVWLYR